MKDDVSGDLGSPDRPAGTGGVKLLLACAAVLALAGLTLTIGRYEIAAGDLVAMLVAGLIPTTSFPPSPSGCSAAWPA